MSGCPGVEPPQKFEGFTLTEHDDECCAVWSAENVCGARRGGSRSRTTCELPTRHAADYHFGRSPSGRWFMWEQVPEGDAAERLHERLPSSESSLGLQDAGEQT